MGEFGRGVWGGGVGWGVEDGGGMGLNGGLRGMGRVVSTLFASQTTSLRPFCTIHR